LKIETDITKHLHLEEAVDAFAKLQSLRDAKEGRELAGTNVRRLDL